MRPRERNGFRPLDVPHVGNSGEITGVRWVAQSAMWAVGHPAWVGGPVEGAGAAASGAGAPSTSLHGPAIGVSAGITSDSGRPRTGHEGDSGSADLPKGRGVE